MRPIATAAVLAALCLTVQGQTTQAQTTAPHRTTSSTAATAAARRRAAAAQTTTASTEGVAAVGTMPAAPGPAKELFALRYIDLKIGEGELARPQMFYTVNYTGWTTDGKKFDSSYDHAPGGEPFTFPAGARRVIVGWDTGFEGMRIGGKRRIIVPYELAYGEAGRPPVIPEKATLIFDLEFLAQSSTPPGPPPPSAPPAGTVPQSSRPQTAPAQQPGTNPVTDPKDQTNKPAEAKPQQ